MRITVESTSEVVSVHGLPVRLWEGRTAAGVRVYAMVSMVGVERGQPETAYTEFERELRDVQPPSREAMLMAADFLRRAAAHMIEAGRPVSAGPLDPVAQRDLVFEADLGSSCGSSSHDDGSDDLPNDKED